MVKISFTSVKKVKKTSLNQQQLNSHFEVYDANSVTSVMLEAICHKKREKLNN